MHTLTFTKMAMAMAGSPDALGPAQEIAERRWGENSTAAKAIKAAVAAATTESWGSPLFSDYGAAITEFIELVRAQTIIGKLEGLRRVPFNTPYLVQTTGAAGAWVQEGKPMPAGAQAYERKTLRLLKVAAMAVQTQELFESPDAEGVIQADLVRAVAEAIDTAFIDPSNAGVAGEQPASVTYDAPHSTFVYTDGDDLTLGMVGFTGDLTKSYLVMNPQLALTLPENYFRDLDLRTGGRAGKLPVILSNALPVDGNGNPQIVLIDPSGIVRTSDDSAARIKSTEAGTIEMVDNPTQDGTTSTGSSQVSMFQANCVAVAALLHENWRVERDGAVLLMNSEAAS